MFKENRRTKISTLMLSCLGLFMVLLDITIVNNALPSIQRHLGASLSGLQWIIDAYTLVFASLLLTTGALSDRQGRKRWFLIGLAVFTLGSALCGLAPNLGVLVAARALQATGGAALLPASLSLLTSAFPNPRERAQAIGLWSGVSGLSLTAGPLIGGTLVDGPGWRWVFFINLPVGVVTFLAALRRVKESVNPRPRRLDPVGQLLAIGTLATLVYALIEGGAKGWTSGLIVTMFALAALGLVAFLVVEARQDQPMIELRLFGSPSFSGTNLIAFLTFFALLGFTFFNTLYFQEIRGYSAFHAGLLILPATIAIVAMAPLAGRLAGARGPGAANRGGHRHGRQRAAAAAQPAARHRLRQHLVGLLAVRRRARPGLCPDRRVGRGRPAPVPGGPRLRHPQHEPPGRRRGRDRPARRRLQQPLPRRAPGRDPCPRRRRQRRLPGGPSRHPPRGRRGVRRWHPRRLPGRRCRHARLDRACDHAATGFPTWPPRRAGKR
jgi:MFS family permease